MYYVKLDLDINKLNIQKEELSEVRWFSMEELNNMVSSGELNPDQTSCFKKACEFIKNSNQ